ncbi:MAG: hypothetical protein WB615_15120 [Candidatus Tumulicola sp.]
MRLTIIGSGFAAVVAAAALAACGGHGTVPSQSFASGNSMAMGDGASPFAPSENAKVHPCDVTGLYYFHGNCVKFTLSLTKNTSVELGKFGAYHGIKITTTFSVMENPPKGITSVAAIMGDAIGDGDITGTVKGKAFPLYGHGENCVNSEGKKEFCPGKPFVYAELINTSKYTLKPKDTPKFYITDSNGFPGKTLCFPAILTTPSPHSVGGWAPNETLGGQPHGTVLTINAQANPGQLVYPSGQFIVAGACK